MTDRRRPGPTRRLLSPILLIALCTLLATAGCLAGETETLDSNETDEPVWQEGTGTGAMLAMEVIPDEDSWVIIEARAAQDETLAGGQGFDLDLEVRFQPASSSKPCFTAGSNDAALRFSHLGAYASVAATPVQDEPVYERKEMVPDQWFHGNYTVGGSIPDDGRIHLLLEAQDHDAWSQSGAEVQARLDIGQPLEWRVVDSGDSTCLGELTAFEEGEVVSAGTLTSARDLRDGFTLNRSGWGTVSIAGSEAHEAVLTGPGGPVWVSETSNPNLSELLTGLEPGSYEYRAPELTGTGSPTAGWHILDVPPWVADMMTPD